MICPYLKTKLFLFLLLLLTFFEHTLCAQCRMCTIPCRHPSIHPSLWETDDKSSFPCYRLRKLRLCKVSNLSKTGIQVCCLQHLYFTPLLQILPNIHAVDCPPGSQAREASCVAACTFLFMDWGEKGKRESQKLLATQPRVLRLTWGFTRLSKKLTSTTHKST